MIATEVRRMMARHGSKETTSGASYVAVPGAPILRSFAGACRVWLGWYDPYDDLGFRVVRTLAGPSAPLAGQPHGEYAVVRGSSEALRKPRGTDASRLVVSGSPLGSL